VLPQTEQISKIWGGDSASDHCSSLLFRVARWGKRPIFKGVMVGRIGAVGAVSKEKGGNTGNKWGLLLRVRTIRDQQTCREKGVGMLNREGHEETEKGAGSLAM